eukprot:8121747-Pyramimonas_sp.AAC.1
MATRGRFRRAHRSTARRWLPRLRSQAETKSKLPPILKREVTTILPVRATSPHSSIMSAP